MLAKVTERTFYPLLIDIIKEIGGSGVQEVMYNSEPDVVFELESKSWILGVKIGEDSRTLRDAFLQYLRHKDESKLDHGILLFLPEKARKVPPKHDVIHQFLINSPVFCLLDTPSYREECRGLSFPNYLKEVVDRVIPKVERGETKSFELNLAVKVLKEHLQELMNAVKIEEKDLLSLVTNPILFSSLSSLKGSHREQVGKFLAAYIILSQIIFLRLLGFAKPELLPVDLIPVSPSSLRRAFKNILEINYRAIFSIDVLNCLEDKFIVDTFNIIWGLRIEEVQHELPGRIYNELMPFEIRKMLAAFFTRPIAADLIANLCIEKSNEKILDPACGSGTLLVSGYKRKKKCYRFERKIGNPHRRFCEEDLFGLDIMPFSVHLAAANLAATEAGTTLEHSQIGCIDSLTVSKSKDINSGIGQLIELFPDEFNLDNKAKSEFNIKSVDVVLMNPPFTKLERGIQQLVNLDRFRSICGKEVGLWGHFIPLAYNFLKDDGILGAVLPINILRGRESKKVRDFLLTNMTPLYIIKPVVNYSFSESAEYRDIIVIAKKTKPNPSSKVKIVLFRYDINEVTDEKITEIVKTLTTKESSLGLSSGIHFQSVNFDTINSNRNNLMYLCGVTNLESHKVLEQFMGKIKDKLGHFPDNYFREGYRPVPKGISKVLFITRNLDKSRIEQAFLRFEKESNKIIQSYTELETDYSIEKECLIPSLRTATGIDTMSINGKWDYIAYRPYKELQRVIRATGFNNGLKEDHSFWKKLQRSLEVVTTKLVINRRINPFSPNNKLVSFFSTVAFSPSNTLHPVLEKDSSKSKAICVLLNSILFWVQFFMLKEESTGRWIDIRHSDLYDMYLYPHVTLIPKLEEIFNNYCEKEFPAFIYQIDSNFDYHYSLYKQMDFLTFESECEKEYSFIPSETRMAFDFEILKVLGVKITKKELHTIYKSLAQEMIVIRALNK